jgi:hypothetical protein
VRKLAPSGGWQTAAEAVARRVVEDEQEDKVEDEEVVQEEDLSDEDDQIPRTGGSALPTLGGSQPPS